MSWPAQVGGSCGGIGKFTAGQGAVMGGDTGGGIVCIVTGDCEGGAVGFLVVRDHLGKGKVVEEGAGHGSDDEAAGGGRG